MGNGLCPHCLRLGFGEQCRHCDEALIPVIVHRALSQARSGRLQRDLQRCPVCDTDGSLGILGRQAASLLSVAISHLFNSPLNRDNKLLAFTDSVQDASHRAAFFGARTYRFNLRTAFQAALSAQTGPARLDEFTDQLLAFWLARWQAEGEPAQAGQRLLAAFMPPDLQQMGMYRRYLDGPGKPIPPDLEEALRLRLSWEVTMEYGFNGRIGRSLEKVGSSLAVVDETRLEQAIAKLMLILPEEFGLLKGVGQTAVRHFLIGLLERTRTRGGVCHPLLERYMADGGNSYLLSKKMQPLLSPFGPQSPRFPRFLNEGSHRDTFDQFLTRGNRTTWYVDWAQRSLNPALGVVEINDLYRLVIGRLQEAGILRAAQQGQSISYGLEPSALLIRDQTTQLRCTVCGQQQTVTPEMLPDWVDQPCLNFRCQGRYGLVGEGSWRQITADSYYRGLYEQGQVARIFSQEHTGLLPRPVREQVEKGFKEQGRADDPNLLTATPTLEMGIDVGDLSAAMACSVLPTTANYLQRIGRAGRATGNSFILALANAKPHDLYYFEQPLEMIAGVIVPPGCYLDAPNMLKRQFVAFAIDSWTAQVVQTGESLPRNVQEMLARRNRDGFPMNWLAFYEQHKSGLIETFLQLFGAVVSPHNQAELREYALGEAVSEAVMGAVETAVAEREELRKQYRSLRGEQEKIQENPIQNDNPEAQIAELEQEMKLIAATIKNLEEIYTLNFFTGAGLLPNYAFPETGVKLRAIITGLETAEGEKRYLAKEYVRAASVAIRELAPFNTFYAEGRKVIVNGLQIQGKDALVESWQFCNRCAMMSPVSTTHYSSTCPQCGSALWHDTGQQHQMLLLREVSARTDAQQSLSSDDGDDRERETYQTTQYLVLYS